ncbi:MAG: DUF3368 domain-containing protein [Clostridia bacterium]|nr:DUF3368 domain-containing protein [Clostridia bacterium]
MHKVVVNSTPLLVLGNIGKLDILRELYGKIYISEAVFKEVSEKNDAASAALRSSNDWIQVLNIENPTDYAMYRAKLHAGEVETMILAQQKSLQADLVILDDLAARKTAKFLGLNVTGTMGVLIKAKQEGIITEVKPLLNDIIQNGFFISDKVIQMVLKVVGE